MKDKPKPFTALLRHLRIDRGWSQEDAAAGANLTFYRYRQIEAVKGPIPSDKEFRALARAFKATAEELRKQALQR